MSLPGGPELLIVLVVVLLLFGASRLPKLARSMGEASKEFKQGMKDGNKEKAEVAGPCPFCKTEISNDAKFCPGCGKPAEEIVAARADRSQKSA